MLFKQNSYSSGVISPAASVSFVLFQSGIKVVICVFSISSVECAVVVIGHMNKAAGNKAVYRGMGSIDFFAVARSALLIGRVEREENLRAVVQIKNNLAAFGHPKAFQLSEKGFEWLGDYEITADEVLGGIIPRINKREQAKKCCENWQKQTMQYQVKKYLNWQSLRELRF